VVCPLNFLVDRGYRGHDETDTTVVMAGQRRGMTPRLKRLLKRRNAIEPVIGHLKNDGRLDRNYLKGVAGDAMLVGAGHKLRLILRKLRLLFAWRWDPIIDSNVALAMESVARAR
jgi:transposase, IS5 family